jgi:hypothetical protein
MDSQLDLEETIQLSGRELDELLGKLAPAELAKTLDNSVLVGE